MDKSTEQTFGLLNPSIYPFDKFGFERIKSNEMLKTENKYII